MSQQQLETNLPGLFLDILFSHNCVSVIPLAVSKTLDNFASILLLLNISPSGHLLLFFQLVFLKYLNSYSFHPTRAFNFLILHLFNFSPHVFSLPNLNSMFIISALLRKPSTSLPLYHLVLGETTTLVKFISLIMPVSSQPKMPEEKHTTMLTDLTLNS